MHDYTKELEAAGIAREVAVAANSGNLTRADLDAVLATDAALDAMAAHNANFERILDAIIASHKLVVSEWAAGTFDKSEGYSALINSTE